MDFYGFNSAPTVRENYTVTGSHSGRRNTAIPDQLSRFIGPSAFTSAPTTSSADTTTPPSRAWSALPYPLKTTLSSSIRAFLEPLHHPFPQRSGPYQDHRPACTLHAFTVRQLRIHEPATPRDREPSSRGIIAFSLPPFFLPLLPPLTIVSAALSTCSVLGFDYFFFGYYFLGFGSLNWLWFWSARLYALLCVQFTPTYQPFG